MAFERDKLREAMIERAEASIAEHGMDGLRARTVAVDAGVSVGTVYNLFGSLDGLLEAVFERTMARFQQEAAPPDDAAGGERRERLLGLAWAYMDFVRRNQAVWSAFLAYNRQREDGANDPYLARQGPLFDLVGDVLRDTALDAGEADRRSAARMLWSSVHGIVTLNYLDMVSEDSERATREQITLLVDLVLAGMEREPPGA